MPLSRSRALSLPIVSISCNSLLGGVGDVADGHGKMNGQWRLHRQSVKRVDRLRVFTMPPIAPEPSCDSAPTPRAASGTTEFRSCSWRFLCTSAAAFLAPFFSLLSYCTSYGERRDIKHGLWC